MLEESLEAALIPQDLPERKQGGGGLSWHIMSAKSNRGIGGGGARGREKGGVSGGKKERSAGHVAPL